MHAPSLHKWHVIDFSSAFIEHHQKFAAAILIAALVALVAGVADHLGTLEFGGVSRVVAVNVEPLTRLTDPQFAHERVLRETYITSSLEHLLKTARLERAYAVVYEYSGAGGAEEIEAQVLGSFEVTQAHITPRFGHVRGMPRRSWLKIQQDERALSVRSHAFFQSYGFELRNERDAVIGYIGLERKHGDAPLQDRDIAQLRNTGMAIERGLLHAVGTLEQPSS